MKQRRSGVYHGVTKNKVCRTAEKIWIFVNKLNLRNGLKVSKQILVWCALFNGSIALLTVMVDDRMPVEDSVYGVVFDKPCTASGYQFMTSGNRKTFVSLGISMYHDAWT